MTDPEGRDGLVLELALDFLRLRCLKARLIRFAVVFDPEDESVSLEELESLDDSDELLLSMSASTPG